MRLYDVSVPIHPEMPVFRGDPRVRVRSVAQIEKGNPFNGLTISLGSHTGTHVDAPYHFEPDGLTVDQVPLDTFWGPATVCDVGEARAVDRDTLEGLHVPRGTRRLLLKTANSRLWAAPEFHDDFVYVAPDGAQWMVQRGLQLVGIDYLSIEKFGSREFPTHHVLLRAGIVIVEGLDLSEVPPGEYDLFCFPLRLANADGAPARAVLLQSSTSHTA